MGSQYEDGEVVEYRTVVDEGNPDGGWVEFRYTKDGILVDRPPSEFVGSLSMRQETHPMEMIVPVNPVAEAIGRVLPLFEKWLEKQVGQAETKASAGLPSKPKKEWYTPEEASAEINRTPNHVRELCRKHIFGKRDAGGRWVINRKDLEAFRLGRIKVHGEVFK